MTRLLLALLLAGCAPADADGDSAPAASDCDDAGGTAWPLDADGDGWGDAAYTLTACTRPTGFAAVAGDCDDHLATTNPGADEVCGGGDEDCDGAVDEADAADATAWYADADGDGAGDPDDATWSCEAAPGAVAVAGDCDDADAATAPGMPELCDGLDQDCDGLVDDADPDLADGGLWYPDVDGDGRGAAEGAVLACEPPAGHVPGADDCDDTDAGVHPGALEACDGIDQDCDARVDEADGALDGAPTWYVDGDGDGFGTIALSTVACAAPPGFVASPDDCADADATISPAAEETCDGVDQDCDGTVDQDALDAPTWYPDADGDTYGDAALATRACTAPAASVADASDCDDADATVLPGATEGCDDGVDQDCDGFERPCPLAASILLGVVGDQWNGETADDRSGHAVAWAGDTDGDGYAEALVTAYREDSVAARAGAAYLVNTWGVGSASLSTAAAKLTGVSSGDHAGSAATGLGDVDGDGFDDLLVGAYLAAPSFAGAAYLVSGPVSSGSLDAQTASFAGENPDDQAGTGVGRVGDVDGDGLAEVAVGAPNLDGAMENIGGTYLFFGPVSGALSVASADVRVFGAGPYAQSGHRLAGGDLDGDGLSDLVVGAIGAREGGAVYVFAGPLPAGDYLLSDADASVVATDTGDLLGWALSAGDSDDDGYTDLLCGAPAQSEAANDAGAAYLFRGPLAGEVPAASADARLLGEATADEAGYSVNLHGDFDGDGRADALVGAWAQDETATTAGATYVELGPFSGVASLGDVYAKLVSNSGGTESGRGVDGGGDIDGDGLTDILVGAPDISEAARGGGGAYVLRASEL